MKQLINSYITLEWPNVEVECNIPIELFIDGFLNYDPNRKSLKILWVKDAEEITRFKEQAIKNHKNFDIILTYDEDVLNQCKNAYFMPFGTTWIDNFDLNSPKKFQVSHLTGFKEYTFGHTLRKKIYYKQDKIKIPKDFYISKYGGVENAFNSKILGESKNPLFESQFHICIENSKQKNWFTEKLIDCFITKTVPIFWGCDNIGDFFETKGMLVVKDFKEIIDICNNLNDNTYNQMKNFIDDNYKKALDYTDLRSNFKNKIEEIIKTYL